MDFSHFFTNHLITISICLSVLGARSTKQFSESDIERYRWKM